MGFDGRAGFGAPVISLRWPRLIVAEAQRPGCCRTARSLSAPIAGADTTFVILAEHHCE